MARPFIKLQANAGLGWAGLGRCGLDPAVALPRTAAALVLRCRVKLSAGSEQENVCLVSPPFADTDGQKFWFRELCFSLSCDRTGGMSTLHCRHYCAARV